MAVLKMQWSELRLFVRSDIYLFTTDNRPFWQFLSNLLAMNQELEELIAETRERARLVVENPVVEDGAGGSYVSETGGNIGWVAVSCTQPGSGGQFVVDVLVNGVSIFLSPSRPVLAFDSTTGYVVIAGSEIHSGVVPPNGVITANVVQVQSGTPRWLSVMPVITPNVSEAAATDFDGAVADLAAMVPVG